MLTSTPKIHSNLYFGTSVQKISTSGPASFRVTGEQASISGGYVTGDISVVSSPKDIGQRRTITVTLTTTDNLQPGTYLGKLKTQDGYCVESWSGHTIVTTPDKKVFLNGQLDSSVIARPKSRLMQLLLDLITPRRSQEASQSYRQYQETHPKAPNIKAPGWSQ